MKVFFLIRSLHPGGAERQMVALANGMADLGHDVTLAIFYSGGKLEQDLNAQVNLVELHKSGRWEVVSFILRLCKAVRIAEPEIIYTFLGTANLLGILLKSVFSVPLVWGMRASDMDLSRYGRLHRFHFIVEILLSRFADAIIANSYAGAQYLSQRGFHSERLKVVHNGIDTETYKPLNNSTADGFFTVGLVARLDPMKDHLNFLNAAVIALKRQPDLRFICIGRGVKTLAQEVAERGLKATVTLIEEQEDMPNVYANINVACLSSAFGEGFPNVLGEAMACGVPCVTTRVGDAVRVIGNTGISVPPENPDALAQGILDMHRKVLTEPKLVEHCRQRIKDHFGLSKLVRQTEALLRHLTMTT